MTNETLTFLTDADHAYPPDSDLVSEQHQSSGDIDLSLLEDSIAKSPWERMQANDDALNFGETLRAAMERRHAESQ